MTARVRNFTRKLNRVAVALKIVKAAALKASTDADEQDRIRACDAFGQDHTGAFVLGHRASQWTYSVPAPLVHAEVFRT